MARKKLVRQVRDIGVDPLYGSEMVQKLINTVMQRGKKSIARSIVYGAFSKIATKNNNDRQKALDAFNKALSGITPMIEVRPKRVGGSVYQIPKEVSPRRGLSLALRWLVDASKQRNDKTMADRLAAEIMDASEGRGTAAKKRADVHKMAESNRAFSHYSW